MSEMLIDIRISEHPKNLTKLKDFFDNSNFNGRGLIIGIGVAREYRRKGIGLRLYKKAISDLRNKGIKRIVVRSWSTNKPSIKLLSKLGFKKYYTVKGARVNGSDSLWFFLD